MDPASEVIGAEVPGGTLAASAALIAEARS